MKLRNVAQIEEFKKAISLCEGEVWLEDIESGTKLNLKSLFTQYLAIGKLISEKGDKLELFCANSSDEYHFYKFFFENPSTV